MQNLATKRNNQPVKLCDIERHPIYQALENECDRIELKELDEICFSIITDHFDSNIPYKLLAEENEVITLRIRQIIRIRMPEYRIYKESLKSDELKDIFDRH